MHDLSASGKINLKDAVRGLHVRPAMGGPRHSCDYLVSTWSTVKVLQHDSMSHF